MTGQFQPVVRFFGKIQIQISESKNVIAVIAVIFLGKSKNRSWIHKIQVRIRAFFLGGVGFEKSVFDKQYTTDAVHVWQSNWTYVDGALTLSH